MDIINEVTELSKKANEVTTMIKAKDGTSYTLFDRGASNFDIKKSAKYDDTDYFRATYYADKKCWVIIDSNNKMSGKVQDATGKKSIKTVVDMLAAKNKALKSNVAHN